MSRIYSRIIMGLLTMMLGMHMMAHSLTPQEIAPNVFVLASSNAHGDANIGWVVSGDQAVLIGAPDAETTTRALELIAASGKTVQQAILTQLREGELAAAPLLTARHIELLVHPYAAKELRALPSIDKNAVIKPMLAVPTPWGVKIAYISMAAGSPGLAVFVPESGVLFAGDLVINGPRAALDNTHTAQWILDLDQLKALHPARVVPARGYVAGPESLDRMQNFLTDLRRQIGHRVARGEPLARILSEVKLPTEFSASMPYDYPTQQDLEHIYRELTVPNAPFDGRPFDPVDQRPKALVLYGDQVHDPLHLGPGLEHAMQSAGIDARLTVDVHALNAELLQQVDLFVILRDGTWFEFSSESEPFTKWMTPEQDQALKDFVERGGGLLAIHNATGIYPEGCEYLKMLGATYNGHGPLEHFAVRVTDPEHPIAAGIQPYEIWDEQHTPALTAPDLHHFLESESAEGIKSSAGWTRTQGKGRVCYLANGHTRTAINHPMVQKLFVNAAQWCLGDQKNDTPSKP